MATGAASSPPALRPMRQEQQIVLHRCPAGWSLSPRSEMLQLLFPLTDSSQGGVSFVGCVRYSAFIVRWFRFTNISPVLTGQLACRLAATTCRHAALEKWLTLSILNRLSVDSSCAVPRWPLHILRCHHSVETTREGRFAKQKTLSSSAGSRLRPEAERPK